MSREQHQNAPSPVVGIDNVDDISAGQRGVCARRTTGEVLCWGDYAQSEEGIIIGNGSPGPEPEPGYAGVLSMAGSSGHRCALLSDGEIFCAGLNQYGQLGMGTVSDSSGFRVFQEGRARCISDAVEVAVGGHMTCARRASGEVLCWGSNGDGQLGDGTTSDHLTPTTVTGLPAP